MLSVLRGIVGNAQASAGRPRDTVLCGARVRAGQENSTLSENSLPGPQVSETVPAAAPPRR